MFIASQIIGVIVIIISVLSLKHKDKGKLLRNQTIAAALNIVAVLLVNGTSGAANQFVGLVRKYWFYINAKKGKKNSILLLLLFSSAAVLATVLTWEGAISLLPMVAIISVTYALWQNNIYVLRYVIMIGNTTYATYNIIVKAYTVAANEIVMLVATIISLVYLYSQNKKQQSEAMLEKKDSVDRKTNDW